MGALQIQARGTLGLRLDPLQPSAVNLTNLQTALGSLTADLRLDQDVWRGRVDIGRLDLRPWRAAQSGSAGTGESAPIPDMALQVTARQLRLGDAPFHDLMASVDRRGGIWRSASVQAGVEDSDVALDLSTAQTSALTMRASDAGWLVRALRRGGLARRVTRWLSSSSSPQSSLDTTAPGSAGVPAHPGAGLERREQDLVQSDAHRAGERRQIVVEGPLQLHHVAGLQEAFRIEADAD